MLFRGTQLVEVSERWICAQNNKELSHNKQDGGELLSTSALNTL